MSGAAAVQGTAGARTLFGKIWDRHTILERGDRMRLLYVDRQFIADDLLPDVFDALRDRDLEVRRPEEIFATPDHFVPTRTHRLEDINDPAGRAMIEQLTRNAAEFRFTLFGLEDPRQGIVHVSGPEQGLSRPGMTIVCADSHTATHGAFGAIAFGIGSAETTHVLATRTLWQRRPRSLRITLEGPLAPGVAAKDLIIAIIARIGAAGAAGHAMEFAGSTIRGLSMEGRMTLCNMIIEAGARTGLVAPDDTTFSYLAGRPFAPRGADWDQAVAFWRTLPSEPDAIFDREVSIDAASVAPMVTWGTSPEDATPVTGSVPDPDEPLDAERQKRRRRALEYMGLRPGMKLAGLRVDRVFIGSCTNGRIEDLRAAAAVLAGRQASIPALVVPGSGMVKRQAEAEGLDRIFKAAGCEWREPGCSLCIAMNGDRVRAGERCAATSNRNFAGRQGRGARTHLMSPAMAAAAAVSGCITDIRKLAGDA
ncbi:MAG: 3-isopropylmalate dehydratase large subunit [Acetobacteraceae bacterium]